MPCERFVGGAARRAIGARQTIGIFAQDTIMSRQDANTAFARTSFLYGGNSAYLENLYGRYESDPAALEAEWQGFFQSLRDEPADVEREARGPSWKRSNWPILDRGDLVAALDGDWGESAKVIGDKVKAKAQKTGAEPSAADVQ